MYTLPTKSSYLRRSLIVNDRKSLVNDETDLESHEDRIKKELLNAKLMKIELWSPEARYLPHIIHDDEHIGGAVYGFKDGNLVMLIATDRRVILLNKKPLFIDEDEIGYDVVAGVSFTHAGPGSTVTLHTRVSDYVVKTFNFSAVEKFVSYIELQCVEQSYGAGSDGRMISSVPRFLRR